ncbi:MAG: septum formation initiator family protein [Deltaproteobacteria bacterium]|nr:septum formation initiator family protein [Deltaproteobacteria bacterium]MBW1929447.1 septum formation initiator family protein [Deltaproteobacteria bacterium]MBW2023894.1 septum formation initiator family protein [Deltaproteobacteria bacterium]MBW2124183.1 septum formation initiator family protein [Deltaproteobacteria bacterium]RLB24745.1 MAG: hypothetical protein DRG76_00460 [Deltaproteobacteria bacterium]
MAKKRPKKRFISIILLLFCMLAPLVAWLGFSKRGFINLYKMDLERQKYIDRIQALRKENQEIMDEIRRLKEDPSYVERVAREELGLIKDNEVIFRFRNLPQVTENTEKKPQEGGRNNAGKQ